jgi:hypothetical protein
MSGHRLQNLADAVGAARPGALSKREIVMIELQADGSLKIEIATGEKFIAVSECEVPGGASRKFGRLTADDIIRALFPNIALSGGRFPVGVPFVRRVGKRGIEFCEVGR